MKTLYGNLQAHLDSGATTLCWCWKLTRTDARVLGFTDHDADVVCDGVHYSAASGMTASTADSACDYSVDNMQVRSILSAQTLCEADIAAGIYDGASVAIYRVNWANPSDYVLMRKGTIGEIKRGANGFQAELRGLMQQLAQPVGRSFCYLCDADFGDVRCGKDVDPAAFRGRGYVTAVTDSRRFMASGVEDFAAGWFSDGRLQWISGGAAGQVTQVRRHGKTAAAVSFELWQPQSCGPAVGDDFVVTAGCDKSFATCRTKFSNAANFRGFPYMIGNNAVVAYANASSAYDGGSRYGN